jgi:hypothetical protein
MSINSCTLDGITIDSFCSPLRARTIAWLESLIPPRPTTKAHQQHIHPDTQVNLNIFRRDRQHTDELEESIDITKTEQLQMSVTIEMAGQKFAQVIERDGAIPMVNVFDLKAASGKDIHVNITDLSIEIK